MNHSLSQAVWVYRLQPPEPASKDAVFKPGASTWNTDDPKQQHHAPGTHFWLAIWHATVACNMACNYGLQHGVQLWLATWHAAGNLCADVHAIPACNMHAANALANSRLQS